MITVQIFSRLVYGTPRIYPGNEAAQLLAEFGGMKTFSNSDIDLMRRIGLDVQTVEDPVAVAMKAAKASQTAGQ
jgi:hypothetical protein